MSSGGQNSFGLSPNLNGKGPSLIVFSKISRSRRRSPVSACSVAKQNVGRIKSAVVPNRKQPNGSGASASVLNINRLNANKPSVNSQSVNSQSVDRSSSKGRNASARNINRFSANKPNAIAGMEKRPVIVGRSLSPNGETISATIAATSIRPRNGMMMTGIVRLIAPYGMCSGTNGASGTI